MKRNTQRRPTLQKRLNSSAGFTVLELAVVVCISSILAGILASGWTVLQNRIVLNLGNDQIYQAMLDTQNRARMEHVAWAIEFKPVGETVQWTAHRSSTASTQWKQLGSGLHLHPDETTLQQVKGVYRVQFNQEGRINGQLGRITLVGKGSKPMRCVIVSTLLGKLRIGQDHVQKRDGKFCY